MTKLASVLEGGLAGATTLSVLTDTLRRVNGKDSTVSLFRGNNLRKRLKKAGSKKPLKASQQYIKLAGDLLGSTAFVGLKPLGKKKNAVLRGAILGTAAGLGALLLDDKRHKSHYDRAGNLKEKENLLSNILEVSLYAIGGAVAGKVIDGTSKKRKAKRK